nr:hypothetical protein [Nitrospinaceae bacterium]NIR54751.1 hypothetical protein [Nitrospinaceae bacterium]NIS85176.1 hypothetical protein [Nitrospinaceae bacterium]NIU44250.1 hypothetical protein [Nitrospinaceae bacterium]NIW59016.1 hypothetical protein [Nitrospinaceae bacterium]
YAVPVIAGMGLPTYGHSTLPLPPKLGITFEEILTRHYRVPVEGSGEKRRFLFNEFGFGYLSTVHSNPALERLREMRHEIVKRPMLATVEKMLMPLQCKTGKNYLATGYFHKGYETAMMAIARLSDFDRTLVGNGMEGTTLYGVHKSSRVFIDTGQGAPREVTVDAAGAFSPPTASRIQGTYEELKKEKSSLDFIGEWGEAALKENRGPAAPLIACQAGLLCHLLGKAPTAQDGFDTASETLKKGKAYDRLMRYIEKNH